MHQLVNEIKHHSAIGVMEFDAASSRRGRGRNRGADFRHPAAPVELPVRIIANWDAFALTSLALAWIGMIFTDVKTRMREAHLQDSGRAVICGCVVFAAVAALFGAGLLLGTTKGLTVAEAGRHVGLAALTVISSWLLVCRAHRAPWSRSAFTNCRSPSAHSP